MSTTPIGNRKRASIGVAPETGGRQARINPPLMPVTINLLCKSAKQNSTAVSDIHGVQCMAVILVGWIVDNPFHKEETNSYHFKVADGTSEGPVSVEIQLPADEFSLRKRCEYFKSLTENTLVRVVGAAVTTADQVTSSGRNKQTDAKIKIGAIKINGTHIRSIEATHYLFLHTLEVVRAYLLATGQQEELTNKAPTELTEATPFPQGLNAPLGTQEAEEVCADLENLPPKFNSLKERNQRIVVGAVLKTKKDERGCSLEEIVQAAKSLIDESAVKEAVDVLMDKDELFEPVDGRYDTVA